MDMFQVDQMVGSNFYQILYGYYQRIVVVATITIAIAIAIAITIATSRTACRCDM